MSRVLFGLVIGLFLAGGGATARPHAGTAFWVPVWGEVSAATWVSDRRPVTHRPLNSQVWAVRYAKQREHTGVQLCGMVTGRGDVLLAYGSAGDPVTVHTTQPTFTCVQTIVGPGGGAANVAVEVYLHAAPGQILMWEEPTLLLQVMP